MSTAVAPAPVFAVLPVGLFGSVMGLTGLSIAWHLAGARYGAPAWVAAAIGASAILVFIALALGYAAKAITAPGVAIAEFRHPIAGNLFGTICINLLLIGTAASAAELPLRPGTYVLAGTPCKYPPFAAMFSYDGERFSYPHASQCFSQILAHHGHRYRIAETCSAMGDGTPTRPVTMKYTIAPIARSGLVKTTSTAALRYRWCPAR